MGPPAWNVLCLERQKQKHREVQSLVQGHETQQGQCQFNHSSQRQGESHEGRTEGRDLLTFPQLSLPIFTLIQCNQIPTRFPSMPGSEHRNAMLPLELEQINLGIRVEG